MVTKISDFIFQKPILGKENKFSSAEEINMFFAKLPKSAINAWPLNLEEQGLKVNYLSARLSNNNWKEDEFLIVQAELINQNNQHATIEQEFRFGANDQLIINMVSLYNQDTGQYPRGMRIARIITEQNFKFISAYDKKTKPLSPSYLSVFASSERIKQNPLIVYVAYKKNPESIKFSSKYKDNLNLLKEDCKKILEKEQREQTIVKKEIVQQNR